MICCTGFRRLVACQRDVRGRSCHHVLSCRRRVCFCRSFVLTCARARRISRVKSLISSHNTILNRIQAFVWARGRSHRSRKVPNRSSKIATIVTHFQTALFRRERNETEILHETLRSSPLPFERHGKWCKICSNKSGAAHGNTASDRASGMLVHARGLTCSY